MLRSLSFRAAFERFHLLVLKADGAAASTITTYRCALAAWEKFGEATLDVGAVRQSHLLAMKGEMIAAGLSPATFDGYWRALRAILSTCVVEGVIGEMPRTPRLKRTETDLRPRPTREQFARLIEATDSARWPHGPVPAAVLWRALYGTAYLTVLRRGDLIGKRGLTWDAVTPEGIGWMPAKTRRRKKWVFCPDVGGAIGEMLEPLRGHGPRVFGLLPMNVVAIQETHRRIATWAGVDPELATFHPLRRAGLDAWCEADETAAGLIGGHGLKLPKVTRERYVGPEAQRARIRTVMLRAAAEYRLPECLQPPRWETA